MKNKQKAWYSRHDNLICVIYTTAHLTCIFSFFNYTTAFRNPLCLEPPILVGWRHLLPCSCWLSVVLCFSFLSCGPFSLFPSDRFFPFKFSVFLFMFSFTLQLIWCAGAACIFVFFRPRSQSCWNCMANSPLAVFAFFVLFSMSIKVVCVVTTELVSLISI